ncbi:MAG: FliH/SctL family protein [Eubacteriales bacterium]|nr:FliH/SctL family protein [Eubacteriales bacterium]
MISLSSIVKSKHLVNLPKKDNINYLKEVTGSVQTETKSRDMSDWLEKKEAIIKHALKKAKHIENEAEIRAEAIIRNAISDSREIMNVSEKKGYDEGYLRGLVDGASASEIAAEESLMELGRMVDCFRLEQKEIIKREEKQLLNVALELSKKIMKHHVRMDEGAILKMLKEIIQENEVSMKIYLSEYQKSLDIRIDKVMAKKIRGALKDTKLVLLKEEDLIMGENESGIVDMSVPAQLEQLKKVISQVV